MTPPITFVDKLATPRSQSGAGYPYQIKANDLDVNFYYATLIVDDQLVEQVQSRKYIQRRLKIPAGTQDGQILYWNGTEYTLAAPGTSTGQILYWTGEAWAPFSAPPASGTHVLGSVNGNLQWIATEEC